MKNSLVHEHFNNWQDAVKSLNDLGWNLSWQEHKGKWYLYGGDQLIFIGETEGELQSFVYGVAFDLATLPDSILEQIKQLSDE